MISYAANGSTVSYVSDEGRKIFGSQPAFFGGKEVIMTNENPTYKDASTTVNEKITDATSQAKAKVADLGRTAAGKIDANRDSAASGLANAASTLHQKADSLPGGEKVSSLAHTAADKLSSTADYVRDHDANSMMEDMERLVKNNPGPSILAAAVVGFLVGRTFTSND